MVNIPDPNSGENKLVVHLVTCERCKNPFMKQKGDDLTDLVCDNCKKLRQRKCELQLKVLDNFIEVENKMEDSIKEMKNQLTDTRGEFNKEFFLEKIKKRAQDLAQSVELLEKIEDSSEEKFVDKYKELFEKMKRDSS